MSEIIIVAVYLGIIFAAFYLFSHFVKKEIGKDKLPTVTWLVTLLAAVGVPYVILNIVKFTLLIVFLVVA